MPPRRKKSVFPKRTFNPLPENAQWIESDSYDRRVYGYLRAESRSLQSTEENGSTFLPHFSSLLQDIFCLLFKNILVFRKEQEVLPSASFNRILLNALNQGDLYRVLRELTLLDEARAGLATLLLGEALLSLIKSEKALTRRDMLDLWDVKKQEEIFGDKLEQAANAEKLAEEEPSKTGDKNFQEAKERLESELNGAEALLRQKVQRLKDDLSQSETRTASRFQGQAIQVARQLEDAAQDAENWSLTLGTGYRSPPGQKLELGKRLAGNEKLKKLAQMVGRMKFHALALRKKIFERSSEEILEIERGDSIHRLLPHELVTIHHPVMRKDFRRRLLDQELLQYSLRGVEEKGKGPMVVCLDGSSSMAGEKEIWSKAVTLTLLEIARRQRRLFRSICFSSEETPLQVLEMNPRERYEVEMEKVMDLAEYFPGGGTNFEKPLDAALDCLRKSRYKKGDIVFITDGECHVAQEWAERFRAEKEKLGFSLFSILIDVGPSSLGTLKEFSDRITTIKELTGNEAKDIFINF
ncbi:MAG: VWA domain-containing protein [Deltaproteobacteria bacterium]|nr:VWA domain-containing protein [Deltaproteobacteria bacterium]